MNNQECEDAKKEAWEVLRDPEATTWKKAWFTVHKLITADYWLVRDKVDFASYSFRRKVHGRRYMSGYKLDIDVYTRHWLWANGDTFPSDIIQEIANRFYYEPECHKMMPKGSTMYVEVPA